MAAIVWRYPEDELARLQAQASELAGQQKSVPVVGIDALNFGYTIQVVKGAPAWTPLQVFDDGRRTFVRFPSAMVLREAPALFVLRDSETQLVNYLQERHVVIDRLIDAADARRAEGPGDRAHRARGAGGRPTGATGALGKS